MNHDINQIAKETRRLLKSLFPAWKFSVTTKKYTGGRTLKVALMSGPEAVVEEYLSHQHNPSGEWLKDDGTRAHQLNRYAFNKEALHPVEARVSNGVRLTPRAWAMMKAVCSLSTRENYDNSDVRVDYFDVNYWFDIEIGKWEKPYVIVPVEGWEDAAQLEDAASEIVEYIEETEALENSGAIA